MFNNYCDIIEFLNSIKLSKTNYGSNGIKATEQVLARINANVDPKKVILIAGTNGKGTTSASLEILLRSAGKNVGLYTSPHLICTNERIKYNFIDISNSEFIESFDYIDKTSTGIFLSQFEYLTLMAYHYFFLKKNVDYAIFEIGLGGTYDATNAIPHDTCVITKLGIDHTDILGNSIESMAKNKLGIVTESRSQEQLLIHAPFPNDEINKMAEISGAKLIKRCNFNMVVKYEKEIPIFCIETEYGQSELSLPGYRACENVALAITAFQALGYNPAAYIKELQKLKWPGRMESIGNNIFLSGDHNIDGIRTLIELLKFYKYKNIHFVVGIGIDKDFDSMLSMLYNMDRSNIYITETSFKPRKIEDYGGWLNKCVYYDHDYTKVLQAAIANKKDGDIIVVTGSLYLIGNVLRLKQNNYSTLGT